MSDFSATDIRPPATDASRADRWPALAVVGALMAAAVGFAAGCFPTDGDPWKLALFAGPLVGLALLLLVAVQPFPLLCLVIATFAADALTQLAQGVVFSVTVSKVLAIPLFVACVRVAYNHPTRLKLDPFLLTVGAFVVWTLASWAAADDWALSLRDTLTFLQLALLLCAIRLLITSLDRLAILAIVAVLSVGASGVVALYQFLADPGARVSGISQNAALLSADLCSGVALALALASRARLPIARFAWVGVAIVQGVAVTLTLSRAAYLAVVPAAMVAGLYYGRPRRFAAILLAGALVVAATVPTVVQRLNETSLKDKSTVGHLLSAAGGVRMVYEHPVLGVGIGNYPLHYLAYTRDPSGLPRSGHNTYLTLAAETGLPGLALFVAFHLFAFQMLWVTADRCRIVGDATGRAFCAAVAGALTAFVLIGFFHNLHIAKYLWIMLALAATPAAFSSPAWRAQSK